VRPNQGKAGFLRRGVQRDACLRLQCCLPVTGHQFSLLRYAAAQVSPWAVCRRAATVRNGTSKICLR